MLKKDIKYILYKKRYKIYLVYFYMDRERNLLILKLTLTSKQYWAVANWPTGILGNFSVGTNLMVHDFRNKRKKIA